MYFIEICGFTGVSQRFRIDPSPSTCLQNRNFICTVSTWVSMLTYAWSSSLQSNHLPQTSSPATLGRKHHALCTIFTLYNVSIIRVSTAPISRIKRKKNRFYVHGKFKFMFLTCTTCKNSHTVMSRLRNGITNVFEQPDNVLSPCMLFYNSYNIGKYFLSLDF